RRGVHGELPDRDRDAADAPSTDAEDLLRIGRDDQDDVVRAGAEVVEGSVNAVRIVDAEIEPPWPLELLAVALDRLADRGCVDDRQHLGKMLAEDSEVEHLVALVERVEEEVLGQVIALVPVLRVRPLRLQLDGGDRGREQTVQAERGALLERERRPLVEEGRLEDLLTSQGRLVRTVRNGREMASVGG